MTPRELVSHPHRYLFAEKINRCVAVHFKKRRYELVSLQEMDEFLNETGHVVILKEKKMGQ